MRGRHSLGCRPDQRARQGQWVASVPRDNPGYRLERWSGGDGDRLCPILAVGNTRQERLSRVDFGRSRFARPHMPML